MFLRRELVFGGFRSADGGEGGGSDPDPDAPVVVADKPREPTEYERQLRSEAARHRRAAQAAREQAAADLAAANAAAEQRVAEAQRAADARLIRAELKAAALAAGIVDVDGLRLVDVSAAKLNDAGEVEGAADIIAGLKAAKPYLFAANGAEKGTTSNTTPPPPPKDAKAKDARDMTPEEWAAERKRLGLHR